MISSSALTREVNQVIDEIQRGSHPEKCVPEEWKLEENRKSLNDAFYAVCTKLWFEMGDTTLNRSGYTNSITAFWDEIIGKKEEEKLIDDVEHLDETWYF